MIKQMFSDWFTGPDGATFDPARALWIAGCITFLIFTAHDIYTNDKFDMINFGLAYGSLLAAGAAGIKIKESTEPKGSVINVPPAVKQPTP